MSIAVIKSWLRSRNISSHAIAAVIVSAATLYTTDQQVRDFTIQLFRAHPTIPADMLALAGIIMKYSSAHSPAGVVAEARTVLASPNAPSVAEVVAATVNPNAPAVPLPIPHVKETK